MARGAHELADVAVHLDGDASGVELVVPSGHAHHLWPGMKEKDEEE